MKWEEVRNIYPNKFVLLRSLEAHIEENKKCIDDVAVVRVLDDEEGYINGLLGLDVLYKELK